jgi:hypothetical protein
MFFERYFAAVDGPAPLTSLDLVADDLHFSILWSDERDTTEIVGGREDLRRFIEASEGRTRWRHHILSNSRDGDTEVATGETRYADGTRVGTFMVFAQLDEAGRMVRYMAARTPVERFSRV